MSNDDNFSLHSYDPNEIDEVDQFYKELSLCFYGQEHKKKISLLMSGSTETTSKPNSETNTNIKFVYVKHSQRSGSVKQQKISSPKSQTKKLIKLLQTSKNTQNRKQEYIQKQLEIIKRLQQQELKDHYLINDHI